MNISIAIYLHCFCFVFIPAIEFNDSLWWLLRFNIAQVLRRSDEVVGFSLLLIVRASSLSNFVV